jgi:hypothetical protein
MPPRIRLVFTIMSLSLFFVTATPLIRELSARSDIGWTPHAMLVPLAESGDRVMIYARGKPLGALLESGQLQVAEEGVPRALTPGDVGLRFNNRDRLRAQRLPLLLGSAAACGVTACLFLLVASGRLAYRGERRS